jgi:hypothetical protein
MQTIDSSFASTPGINDTLLPAVATDSTFTSTPVINDTLLPTVTINSTFTIMYH